MPYGSQSEELHPLHDINGEAVQHPEEIAPEREVVTIDVPNAETGARIDLFVQQAGIILASHPDVVAFLPNVIYKFNVTAAANGSDHLRADINADNTNVRAVFTLQRHPAHTVQPSANSQQAIDTQPAAPHQIPPPPLPGQYQLLARQPDPRRFALQTAHNKVSAPPPALILATPRTYGQAYAAHLTGKASVEAQPLLGRAYSMDEIMKFDPNKLQFPEVAMRAIRNDHRVKDLAHAFLLGAGLPQSKIEYDTAATRIRKSLSLGARTLLSVGTNERMDADKVRADLGTQVDLTADAWERRGSYSNPPKDETFSHVRLDTFYFSVPAAAWQTGSGAKTFTRCLRYAQANPTLNLDTSHFDWIIRTQGL
ncbi:hypothetical protein LTR53_001849 [Teratosphaeriaceae sp. CCFEE 6253]|nr:hypothetical protein LTR53_001849 [Teratosphaeriaceae sp. CCFEE 6253]